MNRTVKLWLKGLVAALVGGGAGGITAGIAGAGIDPGHFNFSGGFHDLLKLAGTCALVNAVLSVSAYLKKSPVPDDENSI